MASVPHYQAPACRFAPTSPSLAQLSSRGDCPLGLYTTSLWLDSLTVSRCACWNLFKMSLATVALAPRPVWNEERDIVIPITRWEDAGEYDRYGISSKVEDTMNPAGPFRKG